MEELYLIEFFIQKIRLQCKIGKQKVSDKKLTVNLDFGTFASFIINESEFEKDVPEISTEENESDNVAAGINYTEHLEKATESNITVFSLDLDEEDREGSTKVFNAGASLLFAKNSDALIETFKLFPLEVSVWTNDDTEKRACVGTTKIAWDPEFFDMVSRASKTCRMIPPTVIKSAQSLRSEVNGVNIGEMTALVRLTHLGKKVVTRFKVSGKGDGFTFRNRTGNASLKCKSYGITRPEQLSTVGIVYESLEMQDPDALKAAERRNQVSLELKAAGLDEDCVMFVTGDQMRLPESKDANMPLPCGNANCKLTKMIQSYLTKDESLNLGRDPKCAEPYKIAGKKQAEGGCCGCNSQDPPVEPKDCGPPSDQPKYFICDVCGGYSNTFSCKDAPGTSGGPCPGSCYLHPKEPKQELNVQRMLYEGLTKLLSSNKSSSNCPDSSKKPPCCR